MADFCFQVVIKCFPSFFFVLKYYVFQFLFISNRSVLQISKGLLRKPLLTEISHGILVGAAHMTNLEVVVVTTSLLEIRLLFLVAL